MTPETLPARPHIAILGAGSWGSALAILLAPAASSVAVYARSPEALRSINDDHANPRYLPGASLPPTVTATSDLSDAARAALLLFAVPSSATREMARELATHHPNPDAILLSCSKGVEFGTGMRMSEILAEIFPHHNLAVLSGPNHAEEVAKGLATAAVIGAHDPAVAASLQIVFTTPAFRSYTSDDLAGIELGGAIKNIFAIASGIATGIGLGDNATAALITRGLAEMIRLGTKLGGRPETFTGLSGVGDLIATCYSHHSRNFRAGIAIGQGQSVEASVKATGMVVEGVPNCLSIHQAARRANVRTPLIDALYAVLYQNKPAPAALRELLTRTPRSELD